MENKVKTVEQLPGLKFSRSAIGGKKNSEVKARVADETKDALQKRCAELGMTESEYIDRLICISLFGMDAVLGREVQRVRDVAGLFHKPGPTSSAP